MARLYQSVGPRSEVELWFQTRPSVADVFLAGLPKEANTLSVVFLVFS